MDLVFDFGALANDWEEEYDINFIEGNLSEETEAVINIDSDTLIEFEALRKIILGAAALPPPTLGEVALNFLKKYYKFVLSPFLAMNPQVSKRAYRSLLSMACAHAKLSKRSEVVIEDAVVAVNLMEENLLSRFESSPLKFSRAHGRNILECYKGDSISIKYGRFYEAIEGLFGQDLEE